MLKFKQQADYQDLLSREILFLRVWDIGLVLAIRLAANFSATSDAGSSVVKF